MINTKAIKAQMILKEVSAAALAEALGVQPNTIRSKINNERPMLLSEAEAIQKALEIPMEQFEYYFFKQDVRSAHESA